MSDLEKFNALKTEIAVVVAPVMSVKVRDAVSSQQAIDAAMTIKEMNKRIEALRKEAVEPLNQRVKEINAYAKAISLPLDQADGHLRAEINAFAQEQEKIRREALRKVEEERIRKEAELRRKQEEEREALAAGAELFGTSEADVAAVVEKQQVEIAVHKAEIATMDFDARQMNIKNTRSTWECKVIDLSLVPKEFLIIQVNEKAAVAAHKAGARIPGLEFVEQISVAIGSKTRVPKTMLGG
jgi:DNA polymerase III alpha subunit (gram-positive type)